jgi:hypothetical protein
VRINNGEAVMKQNITLSIEKELLKKGKLIAARNDTSISKMLADLLEGLVEKEDQYQAAKRSARDLLKKGYHLGGRISWTREDLHER